LVDATDTSANSFVLSLALGVGAPLCLISLGGVWLLVRWQMKRRKQALQGAAQAGPWTNGPMQMQPPMNGPMQMQPPLQSFQSAAGATLTMPTSSAGFAGSPTQSVYTVGNPYSSVEPPMAREDQPLESAMRQAQNGLFVLLGRETG
jgi:hypothetical protein